MVTVLAALALLVTPVMDQEAHAADCWEQTQHPDCFIQYVEKQDRVNKYWAVGSYTGGGAFTLKLELLDTNGDLLEYATKYCTSSCSLTTDSVSSTGQRSLCARFIASNASEIYRDTKCRVV